MIGEGFHTIINGGVFSYSTNVGHHIYILFFIINYLVNKNILDLDIYISRLRQENGFSSL